MVNKIAVMAVVLIVSVPILLGYGMAFEEVTRGSWDESDERAISGLLYNEESWTYLSSNSYSINNQVLYAGGQYFNPYYTHIQATPYTSLPVSITHFPHNSNVGINMGSGTSGTFAIYAGSVNITMKLVNNGTVVATVDNVQTAQFANGTFYGYYKSGDDLVSYSYQTSTFNQVNFSNGIVDLIHYNPSGTRYADPTYGWQINQHELSVNDIPIYWTMPDLKANLITMTIDFGTTMEHMDDGDLTLTYGKSLGSVGDINVLLHKETSNCYMEINGTRVPIVTNNGDFSASNNVWQLTMDLEKYTWDYVKDWPGQFGRAPSYYTLEIPYSQSVQYIDGVKLDDPGLYYGLVTYSPIYRADFVSYRSMPFPIIKDNTYDPLPLAGGYQASFRLTFDEVSMIGDSFTFGGETFTVNNGVVTLPNNSKVKMENITLDSRLDENGVRTSYINNQEISTGYDTSITLSGKWGAIVVLDKLTYNETTSTEWQPGEFAWNGVDSSFALMGLIACVGVFVGLGMYGARSGAKVGMLMLICGGAALIFLALI